MFILHGDWIPIAAIYLKPWSDRAAQIVKPSDLCHVHVESVPFSWYGQLPWPSDCRQVACIQGKDPRALQSRRGVHLATGSEGSKYTTWCPSNEPIQPFSSCHLACIRQLDMAVVISPCGSCYRVFYAVDVWVVEAFSMSWGFLYGFEGFLYAVEGVSLRVWDAFNTGYFQGDSKASLICCATQPVKKSWIHLRSLKTSWRGISFTVKLDELFCDFN